jgi:carboxyl-terminal processing protease
MSYGQVKLTRSKFYRISGESTQHRGVLPDIAFPDFYDAYDDIGESSLDGALPWDTVRPVEFRTYHPVQAFLPKLRELHELRAAESPDFNYLVEQIERTRTLRERETLPLNEAIVKADRERVRRIEFEAENLRRSQKGLELKEWIDEEDLYDDDDEVAVVEPETSLDEGSEVAIALTSNDTSTKELGNDTGEAFEEGGEDADDEEETDPLLLESGRILADFINLSSDDLSARF